MKKLIFAVALLPLVFTPALQAEYLFNGYLNPSATSVDYFDWAGFTSASPEDAGGGVNHPTNAPGSSTPVITQLTSGAILAGESFGVGRIYSHEGPMSFSLTYDPGYALNADMLLFQFQTSGAAVDFSSIALKYSYVVGGQTYTASVAAAEYIQEFRKDGSISAMGFSTLNRIALGWDLSELKNLGAQSFEIVWEGSGIGMSFHDAMLDLYDGPSIVPEGRRWTASGTNLNWSEHWQGATSSPGSQDSVEQGNVRFENVGDASVQLNSNRKVGELSFDSADDVQLNIAPGSKLSIYTGIFTSAGATGAYTISGDVELGALGMFDIAGGTVEVDGQISGDYGLVKQGDGTLLLRGDNTFGSGTDQDKIGYLAVLGGVVDIDGTNSYTGVTSVVSGELRVRGDVAPGVAGALGKSTGSIIVGGNEEQYADGENANAKLVIIGDHTISRTISVRGTVNKSIGATNTEQGAAYSGALALTVGTATIVDNLTLFAENSTDRFSLSGEITAGAASASLFIAGQGTVVFSGVDKTYQHKTDVASGTLLIAEGVSLNQSRTVTVRNGASLIVNGVLGASAGPVRTLVLEGGARLGGSGVVGRAFTLGNQAVLAAGQSVGLLTTIDQTWQNNGILEFEIDENHWDEIAITGKLTVDLTGSDTFLIRVIGLDAILTGEGGLFDGTADNQWTFLTTTGGIVGFDADRFVFDASGLGAGFDGLFRVEQSGDDLRLVYTVAPIPEPGTYALIGVGAALYGFLRRRRKAA